MPGQRARLLGREVGHEGSVCHFRCDYSLQAEPHEEPYLTLVGDKATKTFLESLIYIQIGSLLDYSLEPNNQLVA